MDSAHFRARGLRCIIGGNEAAGEHRAGYNGVHALMGPRQRASAFVPFYAGLNLEHYFDGFNERTDPDSYFEPRRAPMQFHSLSASAATLYQPATPFWGIESWTAFSVREPCYVDITYRCVPRKSVFENGCLGAFWASYINRPESKAIHFRGRRSRAGRPRWLSHESPRHGERSSVRQVRDGLRLPVGPGNERFMYASMAPLRYEQAYYYGIRRGWMILLMFDCEQVLRFSHSPSGGGRGNPAWDFYMLVPGPSVGQEYELRARLCYKPFVSRRDASAEWAAWKKSLTGERGCD
jgi:hypothetical protein